LDTDAVPEHAAQAQPGMCNPTTAIAAAADTTALLDDPCEVVLPTGISRGMKRAYESCNDEGWFNRKAALPMAVKTRRMQ